MSIFKEKVISYYKKAKDKIVPFLNKTKDKALPIIKKIIESTKIAIIAIKDLVIILLKKLFALLYVIFDICKQVLLFLYELLKELLKAVSRLIKSLVIGIKNLYINTIIPFVKENYNKLLKYVGIVVAIVLVIVVIKKSNVNNPNETVIEEIEPPVIVCEVINHNKVYLAINESYLLDDVDYVSGDDNVAQVEGNVVKGIGVGNVTLTKDCNTYEIEVTDMITAPYVATDKQKLPCHRYSEEENDYLDEVLASKIKNVGYKTRAGAVEAARFLLLQFPYHMQYFSENGRLPYCDGEGRYYHEGLYLNPYKVEKENITKIVKGPAEWGCRIYSNPAKLEQVNSLDCSGFVTWALVNGGFDPGDIGAGRSSVKDCSDLGEINKITEESLDEVKVGDLFGEDGHISILIGINNGYYYIAESNLGIDIQVRISSKQELINSKFYGWIDMDEFYNHEDGLLTNYWEEE